MRIFNRLQKQAGDRRRPASRPHTVRLHQMVNSLLAYALEVDAFTRDQLGEGKPTPAQEDMLLAGERLREDAKSWLE